MSPRQRRSPLSPYTTLFRSGIEVALRAERHADVRELGDLAAAAGRFGPRAGGLRAGGRFAIPRGRKSTRLNSSHQITSYAVFCSKTKTRRPRRLLPRA